MPEEVRLWRVERGDKLRDIAPCKLDLESRIETWLAQDISILAPDLLVIGRQVQTDFGGVIDLLCVDRTGALVVVELKRNRTPREITAQVLDYGAWVKDLSVDRILAIAEAHLGTERLESAFTERFEVDLPEALNESHRLLIVGSEIDPSSERIIRYLSDTHGVSINAARFQFFRDGNGSEILARVFLIEPEQVERHTRTKGTSKRRPNLSPAELESHAADNGVLELYQHAVAALGKHFSKHTTRSSICFTEELDTQRKAIISLLPGESNEERGLAFQVYFERLKRVMGCSEKDTLDLLPIDRAPWIYYPGAGDDFTGFAGHFADLSEVDRLVAPLPSLGPLG